MINKAIKEFYKEISKMDLTDGQIAQCQQIAREIIKELIAEHVKTCPHALKWRNIAAVLVGAVLGSGLINGGLVFAALRYIMFRS